MSARPGRGSLRAALRAVLAPAPAGGHRQRQAGLAGENCHRAAGALGGGALLAGESTGVFLVETVHRARPQVRALWTVRGAFGAP